MLSVVVVCVIYNIWHYVKVHPDIRCISYFLSFVLHKFKDILNSVFTLSFTYHYTKETFFISYVNFLGQEKCYTAYLVDICSDSQSGNICICVNYIHLNVICVINIKKIFRRELINWESNWTIQTTTPAIHHTYTTKRENGIGRSTVRVFGLLTMGNFNSSDRAWKFKVAHCKNCINEV